MRYKVTAEHPRAGGFAPCPFGRGDVLEMVEEAGRSQPDSDGDYYMCRVLDGEAGYINRGDVVPETASYLPADAIRAALVVKGVEDVDELIRLATAIADAL